MNTLRLVPLWSVLLISFGVTAVAADVAPATPFIHVSGEAKESVPPDKVTLSFEMTGRADTYADALKSTDARFNALVAFLADQKIPKESVTSFEIEVQLEEERDRPYEPGPPGAPTAAEKKPSYLATRRVEIMLKEVKQFPGVYDKLLQTETEGSIEVAFDTSKREDLEKKLLLESAEAAKKKAEALGASLGMVVDGVHAISEQNFRSIESNFIPGSPMPWEPDMAAPTGGMGGRSREYYTPKSIEITSEIFVIFNIKAK